MKRLKNLAIRCFYHFLKQNPNPFYRDRPKILIASTTALGDTLWATPAIAALKRKFPWSKIDVLTSSIGMEVLSHNPDIDTLFLLKEPVLTSFFSLRKKLLERRYNLAFLFHASQRLTLPLIATLGANRVIGTKGLNKGLDFLLTDLTENTVHELDRRKEMVQKVDCEMKDYTLHYQLLENEKKNALKYLNSIYLKKDLPISILHPGAKDSFKCWPAKNFIRLAKELRAKKETHILITGGSDEKDLMHFVASHIEGSHVLDTPLSLREFAAILSHADLIVTNDTGPMHLACALQKKVIALFAPTRPEACGPVKVPSAVVIAKPRTCTPCLKRSCRDPFCLRQIGVSEVVDQALKLLSKNDTFSP